MHPDEPNELPASGGLPEGESGGSLLQSWLAACLLVRGQKRIWAGNFWRCSDASSVYRIHCRFCGGRDGVFYGFRCVQHIQCDVGIDTFNDDHRPYLDDESGVDHNRLPVINDATDNARSCERN